MWPEPTCCWSLLLHKQLAPDGLLKAPKPAGAVCKRAQRCLRGSKPHHALLFRQLHIHPTLPERASQRSHSAQHAQHLTLRQHIRWARLLGCQRGSAFGHGSCSRRCWPRCKLCRQLRAPLLLRSKLLPQPLDLPCQHLHSEQGHGRERGQASVKPKQSPLLLCGEPNIRIPCSYISRQGFSPAVGKLSFNCWAWRVRSTVDSREAQL